MEMKKWVWEHENYPAFTYNSVNIDQLLLQAERSIGKLEGTINYLNDKNRASIQIDAATSEIVSSSEIEGEILSRDSVRSSVKKKLDDTFDYSKNRSTRHTDGLVDVLIDSSFNHEPLTAERIHGWHNALFPGGYSGLSKIDVAKYRKREMSVISGRETREKIHYIAPPQEDVTNEMEKLFDYVNSSQDNSYVKSAIAHLWFVVVHPYDDGNGRLARAITNYVLSKELGIDHKYFSISSAVKSDLNGYYEVLDRSNNLEYNRDFDFTEWISWHTKMIKRAVDISLKNIEIVVDKTKFWDRVRDAALNKDQIKVLNRLLDVGQGNFKGGLTNKKYRSITDTTQLTASRHIRDLVEKGFLFEIEGFGGRSTRYDVAVDSDSTQVHIRNSKR